jgi:hypothetical protein
MSQCRDILWACVTETQSLMEVELTPKAGPKTVYCRARTGLFCVCMDHGLSRKSGKTESRDDVKEINFHTERYVTHKEVVNKKKREFVCLCLSLPVYLCFQNGISNTNV